MHPLLRRDSATVYTADPVTRRYTVVDRTNLDCALLHASRVNAQTSQDRAALAAERIFVWPATEYALPANCQIEVSGLRWNVVNVNAYERFDGPTGALHHGRVPVRRAT